MDERPVRLLLGLLDLSEDEVDGPGETGSRSVRQGPETARAGLEEAAGGFYEGRARQSRVNVD